MRADGRRSPRTHTDVPFCACSSGCFLSPHLYTGVTLSRAEVWGGVAKPLPPPAAPREKGGVEPATLTCLPHSWPRSLPRHRGKRCGAAACQPSEPRSFQCLCSQWSWGGGVRTARRWELGIHYTQSAWHRRTLPRETPSGSPPSRKRGRLSGSTVSWPGCRGTGGKGGGCRPAAGRRL